MFKNHCGNCGFPRNYHTKKLGEISGFQISHFIAFQYFVANGKHSNE